MKQFIIEMENYANEHNVPIIEKDSIDWNNNQNVKSLEYNESNIYTLDYSDTFPYCITFYIEDNNTNYRISQISNFIREMSLGLELEYDSNNSQLLEYSKKYSNYLKT